MSGEFSSPDFLRNHIRNIIEFRFPEVINEEFGGFQRITDGKVESERTLVAECRLIFNFATGVTLLGDPGGWTDAVTHGLSHIKKHFRQPHGGFAWVLGLDNSIVDGTKQCYGHAFVLLAAAWAAKIGVSGAKDFLYDAFNVLEGHFFDAKHGLYRDQIEASDWTKVEPYRGANANMHACEALIAAYEATQDQTFLDKALHIAKRFTTEFPAHTQGLLWEHYTGVMVGHMAEWAKLLLLLKPLAPDTDWLLPTAQAFFDKAYEAGHNAETGGLFYTVRLDGSTINRDTYFWVVAEFIGAAGLLAQATKNHRYWDIFNQLWTFAMEHLVEEFDKGLKWRRLLRPDNSTYPLEEQEADHSCVDYHPLGACAQVLSALSNELDRREAISD